MILIINSVLAGVFAGVVAAAVGPSGPVLPAVAAAAGFVLSVVVFGAYEERAFNRDIASVPVAFPADGPAGD
jgi:hypothetical protein